MGLNGMTPQQAQAFAEKSGDQLVQLVKEFRAARPNSDHEDRMRTILSNAMMKMGQEPDVAPMIATYLANVVCALNDALPARKRRY